MNNLKFLVFTTLLLWAVFGSALKLVSSSNIFTIISISLLASSSVNFIYYKKTNGGRPIQFSWKMAVYSLLGYFFYWFFLLHSIEFYDGMMGPCMVLNYTWPIFTGLFTLLIDRQQKADRIFYTSLACGFMGILVLASEGSFEKINLSYSFWGLISGIGAGMSFGYFSAFSSTLKKDGENAQFLLIGTFLSSILLAVVSFYKYGWGMFDLSVLDWCIALSIGLFLDSVGYIFWTRAQAIVSQRAIKVASILSWINYLPIFSILLLAVFFPSERTLMAEPYFLVAAVLVLFGSLLPHLWEKIEKNKQKEQSAFYRQKK